MMNSKTTERGDYVKISKEKQEWLEKIGADKEEVYALYLDKENPHCGRIFLSEENINGKSLSELKKFWNRQTTKEKIRILENSIDHINYENNKLIKRLMFSIVFSVIAIIISLVSLF